MKLQLEDVSKGAKARVLAPTSAMVVSGQAALVQAETEQRPTVLGLIATGRMKPDGGEVLFDGKVDARGLRRASALVDAPDVSDPDADVLTVGVVAEELMYAGRPSNPLAARKWMTEHGYGDIMLARIGTVEPSRRIRILAELAAERPGVGIIVIVSPDRHGGRPQAWWRVAEDLADRDYAVLVIAGRASWQVLLGEDRGPDFADGMPTVDVEPLVLPDPQQELDDAATAATRVFGALDYDHELDAAEHDADTELGTRRTSDAGGPPVYEATLHEDHESAGAVEVEQESTTPTGGDRFAVLDTGDMGGEELVYDSPALRADQRDEETPPHRTTDGTAPDAEEAQ